MYIHCFKRIVDCLLSIIALFVLSPMLILLIFFLYFANKKSGVFFIQQRVGKNNKVFKLIKFKTMTDEVDENGNYLSDELRLTPLGNFIRSTSLDELPQLVNVIKGDMSLIGPRPLILEYLPLYSVFQMRRNEVRPGITGWAQINGRNDITWTEKFKLDVWYVYNCSFWLYVKILFITCLRVIKRTGVSKDGCATTIPFDGKN